MMKKETKQRIAIVCIGIPLALLAAMVGAGLAGLAELIYEYGWPPRSVIGHFPPEDVILKEILSVRSAVGIISVWPALVTMIVFHAVRRTPLVRHALFTAQLSFLIAFAARMIESKFSYLVNFKIGYENYQKLATIMIPADLILLVSAAICVAVVVAVELLMKKKLQTEVVFGQYIPPILVWLLIVAVHACYYAASSIAQAGPPTGLYNQGFMWSWSYHLLAFAFLRLPFWMLALAVFLWLRAIYCRWNNKTAQRETLPS